MADNPPSFITYTKGAVQYVTDPRHETHFLNWLATIDKTSDYARETNKLIAVRCSPWIAQATKKEACVVLKLVKDTSE
jgi:hypothetical protein